MAKFLLLAALVIVITFPYYYFFLKSPATLNDFDVDTWWGPEELKSTQNTSINPFKIKFEPEMVKELQERLKLRSTFTPPLQGTAFQYGFNSGQLKEWIKYWSEEYPFSDREKFLNKYPQFTTNIQGLDIHYIKVSPKPTPGVEVVPIILLHGWPGSVREFYEAVPLLTSVSKRRDFALEVIIPSLPGYGFSSPAVRPGLGANEVAIVMRNLMQRLGYKKYYVQGGDWGSIIGSSMATYFPNEVLGYHTNMLAAWLPQATLLDVLCSFFPSLIVSPELADRMYPLADRVMHFLEEFGYMHLQATKPDTIGVALTDSPAGLLAYILEKFSSWTNMAYREIPDGGFNLKWTKEKLIDNLMFYWAPKSITTSMRLYSETFNKRHMSDTVHEVPTYVPTWGMQAKHELSYQPPALIKYKYPNLVNSTVLEDGGHFLAFELPNIFADDVLKAVTAFRKLAKGNAKTEL